MKSEQLLTRCSMTRTSSSLSLHWLRKTSLNFMYSARWISFPLLGSISSAVHGFFQSEWSSEDCAAIFAFLADGIPALSLQDCLFMLFDIVFWHDRWILTSGAFAVFVSLSFCIAIKWFFNAVFLKSFPQCIKLASPDLTENNDSLIFVWHNTNCSMSILYFIFYFSLKIKWNI